jgi:hypothetical protein
MAEGLATNRGTSRQQSLPRGRRLLAMISLDLRSPALVAHRQRLDVVLRRADG